jgi:hypothetical protein
MGHVSVLLEFQKYSFVPLPPVERANPFPKKQKRTAEQLPRLASMDLVQKTNFRNFRSTNSPSNLILVRARRSSSSLPPEDAQVIVSDKKSYPRICKLFKFIAN